MEEELYPSLFRAFIVHIDTNQCLHHLWPLLSKMLHDVGYVYLLCLLHQLPDYHADSNESSCPADSGAAMDNYGTVAAGIGVDAAAVAVAPDAVLLIDETDANVQQGLGTGRDPVIGPRGQMELLYNPGWLI